LLSIIIVNYRSALLIIDCLQSVYHYNSNLEFEVIIVDNHSEDESQTIIQKDFPAVQWINMDYNAGYARGNNAGMKAAKGDVYLLLNPDTVSIDDSITRCYNSLQQSDCIAAGIQLINPDKSLQISGGYFVKGGLNHLLPIPYWGNFIRWLAYNTSQKVPHVAEAAEMQKADWINGAFLMVKKEAVEEVGLLDEDFFLYAEEIEWCSRLKKTGPLCIFGKLSIIHLQGETINQSQKLNDKGYYNLYDKKGLQLMVSNHLRIRKQYGAGWFLFSLLNYTWGIIVFAVGGTLHCVFSLRSPLSKWKKLAAYTKNVVRLWKITPTILQNKKHFYKMF
jgi:GT2 family glycosyltransferase